MNFKTTVLGITTLLSLCGALIIFVLFDITALNYSVWGVTGALAILWLLLNRKDVFQFLTRKSTRYGANVTLIIFLVFGILFFLNVISKEHNWRKDFTRTSSNTLSAQSQKILAGLPSEVKAYYFNELKDKDKGDDLFNRYTYLSSKIKYQFVDISRRPTLVQTFGVKRTGAVVLELANSSKRIIVDAPTEEQVTNGLMKLLRANEVSIYFTTGHEEYPLTGENPMSYTVLKSELEKQGYSVKELNLISEGKVPSDAAVLVVGGPLRTFFPKELEILSAWIKGGGHALLAVGLDVNENGLSAGSRQLAALVKPYGIQVMSQMLIDPTSKQANVEPRVILGFSGSKEHAVTRDFAYSRSVANFLLPFATYLTRDEGSPFKITPLAVSSETAWAESDWAGIKRDSIAYNANEDHLGKMDLVYAVEAQPKEGEKPGENTKGVKFLLFANAFFATNNLVDKVGNRDLILNSVAWLADDDRFISIRATDDPDALKAVSAGLMFLVMLVPIFVLPLFVIALGLRQWWRRSKL